MSFSIDRVSIGIWTAALNGIQIGSIFADQPAGGIAQARVYTATFKPTATFDPFHFTGSLKACKQYLTQMAQGLA